MEGLPMEQIEEFYNKCRQCPRKCGVNRTASTVVECPQGRIETTADSQKCGFDTVSDLLNHHSSLGFCRETSDLRIAFAGLHFGEEPLVTVFGGSGTIFFTGCTLRCAFCQNYQISQDGFGRVVDCAEFTDICLSLQAAGAENINPSYSKNRRILAGSKRRWSDYSFLLELFCL